MGDWKRAAGHAPAWGPGLSEYTQGLLPELADAYRVIRFQQRGLEPSSTEGPFDIETSLADVLSVLDPLGAVPDGGKADLGRILGERVSPAAAARAAELDERALRGEGPHVDQLEGLGLVWPGYFAIWMDHPGAVHQGLDDLSRRLASEGL